MRSIIMDIYLLVALKVQSETPQSNSFRAHRSRYKAIWATGRVEDLDLEVIGCSSILEYFQQEFLYNCRKNYRIFDTRMITGFISFLLLAVVFARSEGPSCCLAPVASFRGLTTPALTKCELLKEDVQARWIEYTCFDRAPGHRTRGIVRYYANDNKFQMRISNMKWGHSGGLTIQAFCVDTVSKATMGHTVNPLHCGGLAGNTAFESPVLRGLTHGCNVFNDLGILQSETLQVYSYELSFDETKLCVPLSSH